MDLISIIIIISIISKIIKKAKEEEQKSTYKNTKANSWESIARAGFEKAKEKATEKLREMEKSLEIEEPKVTYEMPKRNVRTAPAYEQVNASRAEAQNTTIMQRAKQNADADKVDVTLQTMEAEHNHSERVAPAKHYHPEDEMTESMLGTVEDLMVKGYEGRLCFERDFVSEGMDMINRFTLGGI